MTRDLAFTILSTFQNGGTVNELMLEKAAQTLDLDPLDILREARLKTAATMVLKNGGELNEEGINYFSAACGYTPDYINKIAELSDLTAEQVIFSYLDHLGFAPHSKLAEFDNQQASDTALQQDPQLLSQYKIDPNQLQTQDPFGNPLVQPSPTAPAQVPEMEGGNMEQLLQNHENKDQIEQEQLDLANQQMLAQEGQQPGSHSKEEIEQALMQADSMGKAQFIMPAGTEDQIQRLAGEIDKVEQMAGLPIKDPAQLKKIMGEIDKQDKKIIDEAIKSISGSATGGGDQFGPLPPPAGGQQEVDPTQQEAPPPSPDMQKIAKKIRFI